MDASSNNVLYRFSIRSRLFIGFLLLGVPLLITMLAMFYQINQALNHATMIRTYDRPMLDANISLDDTLLTTQLYVYKWIFFGNREIKDKYQDLKSVIDGLITNMDRVIKSADYPDDINLLWQNFKSKYPIIYTDQEKLLAMPSSPTTVLSDEAAKLVKQSQATLDSMIATQKQLSSSITNMFTKDAAVLIGLLVTVKWFGFALLCLAILLTLFVPYFTARSIVPPLHEAIRVAQDIANGKRLPNFDSKRQDELGLLLQALKTMYDAIYDKESKLVTNEEKTRVLFDNMVQTTEKYSEHSSRVAAGDLSKRISVAEGTTMQQLGQDLNTMTDSLSTMTNNISNNSEKIITIVDTIKKSITEQSLGMSEQSAAINQISASLEEIDKSSKKTIEKAQNLRDAAKDTLSQGNKGKESVQEVIRGMKTLREQVGLIEKTIVELSVQMLQIGEITAAVTTLSQQSKMLALNASIEAAKAGESGKGFAVVANEVKTLAEQSERATTQVQKILDDIKQLTDKAVVVTEEGTKTVDQGSTLIQSTAEVITTLCESISTASVLSQQMEAAIRQEGIGIDQITAGMNEINAVSSSFDVGIKQTSEVVNQLAEVSKDLKKDVGFYKL